MTTTVADFLSVDQQAPARVARDGWSRPFVELPDGGGVKAYTRASTLGKALTDEGGLTQWKQRLTAIGVASRRDLIVAVNAHRQDNKKMSELVESAMDAAEAGAAATTGTALHDLCDQYDAGHTPYVTDDFKADVEAYIEATRSFEVMVSEEFCVNDEFECAGTPDRIYRLTRDLRLPDKFAPQQTRRVVPRGTLIVGDIKTSQKLDFGHISHSVQIALYSGAKRYTVNTDRMFPVRIAGIPAEAPGGDRADWVPGEQVDPSIGLIVHLPSGGGRATICPVDLEEGRRLAGLAVQVRGERKRKFIGPPMVIELASPDWATEAQGATTLAALREVWTRCSTAKEMTPELRDRFTARAGELS